MNEDSAAAPERLSVKEWADSVFHRPVHKPYWWWDEHALFPLSPDEHPSEALDLLSSLLEAPASLAGYSDAQLATGLWYLFDASCSGYSALLRDPQLPVVARVRGIEAIFNLYRDVFAVRCPPHSTAGDPDDLRATCFMLWDVAFALEPRDAAVDEACVRTLARILTLAHPVCQRSALHGLGHWAKENDLSVAPIIDRFLLAQHDLDEDLRAYAVKARDGHIQ